MNSNDEARRLLDRLREAMRSNDTESPLGQAVARLKQPFVLGDGKQWLYERFISMASAVRQALAAIDDTISPDLPPLLLDPAIYARFFRIPLEDFNWQGGQGGGMASEILIRLEAKAHESCDRLKAIEANLTSLVQHHTIKEFYTTDDLCKMFGKAPYTVREWCRLGRIKAKKVAASCGGELEWRIPHEELLRIQNEGLLPITTKY